MTTHPLAEVRERSNPDWLSITQEAILDVLRHHPTVHADDLEYLGIPDPYRNSIGSAFAALSSKRWIEGVDRRASRSRRRNSAKSGVYQLTNLGRVKLLAGVGGENVGESPACSLASGSSPDPGEATPVGETGPTEDSGAMAEVGSRARVSGPAAPEPCPRLFEPEAKKPGMFDPDSEAA